MSFTDGLPSSWPLPGVSTFEEHRQCLRNDNFYNAMNIENCCALFC